MTVGEAILQGLRAWLQAALALDDDQVIPSGDAGPRPALPYLTVNVLTHDEELATIWRTMVVDDDHLVETATGPRGASVSLQAFGNAAIDWLEQLGELATRDGGALLRAEGLSLVDLRPVVDQSLVVDTHVEARAGRDLVVEYLRSTTRETPFAEQLEVSSALETTSGAADLSFVTTLSL